MDEHSDDRWLGEASDEEEWLSTWNGRGREIISLHIPLPLYISINPYFERPSSSNIFFSILFNDFSRFRSLLGSRSASLRDIDELGRTLLHCSLLRNKGPDFCRFLLDQGAETQVNVLSFRCDGISKAETPLHTAIAAIPKVPEPWHEPPEWAYERIRWLLEAGADVHIPDSSGISCLDLAFSIADNKLKSIVIPHADIDVIGHILVSKAGGKPLLRQWLEHGPESTLANINLLVESGTDPQAKNSLGQTCLHLVLESAAADSPLQPKELRRVLVQLIKNGADVNAANHNGDSVTDLAFHHRDPQSTLGTYPADLWACSLAACGHNVFVDFQNSQPRLPRFDSQYTSKDFEALWDGVKDRSYIFTNILHSPKETLNDSFSAVAQVFQPGDLASLLQTEPCLFEAITGSGGIA
ncbi:hypothetical protein CDV36_004478 [Fusarium kuroshium]|uniref:Uncharacterized protein n=1 Tax=Fusarium kuroshium TaxID=2010991 RepID=A0A3M2SE74_9HYPO|nr:hypothetical protein CDV36_004478 [Fusarium kuroshium]